jgi:hypothetical protein
MSLTPKAKHSQPIEHNVFAKLKWLEK